MRCGLVRAQGIGQARAEGRVEGRPRKLVADKQWGGIARLYGVSDPVIRLLIAKGLLCGASRNNSEPEDDHHHHRL